MNLKRFDLFPMLIALSLAVVAMVGLSDREAHGDTGKRLAPRVEVGSTTIGGQVWCASHTVTALFAQKDNRPDAFVINVSSYTVYIGSMATGRDLVTTLGIPIVSTQSAALGSFPGAVGCTNSGDGRSEVRIWEGLTP